MTMDWPLIFKKERYQILSVSNAWKCTIFTLQVGDALLHFDMTVLISPDEGGNNNWKMTVKITGQNDPKNKFIQEFKNKMKNHFKIINTSIDNCFIAQL